MESVPFARLSSPTCLVPVNLGSAVASCSFVSETLCPGSSSKQHISETLPSANGLLPHIPEDDALLPNDSNAQILQVKNDDILSGLELFSEDGAAALDGNNNEVCNILLKPNWMNNACLSVEQ